MTTENPATIAELREALQFAIQELDEASDKLWISHCNHPGDYGYQNKDSLGAQHRREDRDRLAIWSDRAAKAKMSIKEVLAK